MSLNELDGLHEHAGRAATRVVDAAEYGSSISTRSLTTQRGV